jgi:hypothetical protein
VVYIYISILVYLIAALPLTVLLWAAIVAAKWGDVDQPY